MTHTVAVAQLAEIKIGPAAGVGRETGDGGEIRVVDRRDLEIGFVLHTLQFEAVQIDLSDVAGAETV